MRKLSKIFLILSVVTLLVGLTDVGGSIAYGLLKPMSAFFFMVFFIVQLFGKEIAQYDQEQRSRRELAERNAVRPSAAEPNSTSCPEARKNPSFTAAHSH